jgi:hypothetical protein
MTTHLNRSELAAIVQRTIRSRPLGDIAELAHAIIIDIEDAGWTIAKADVGPVRYEPGHVEMVDDASDPPMGSPLSLFSRCLMRKPIVVTVSHQLGRDEAKRRLFNGLQQVDRQIAAARGSLDYSWDDYRLNFSVTVMRQLLIGHTDVEDENIRIEIHLPFLLHMLADPLASRVESDTELLLKQG